MTSWNEDLRAGATAQVGLAGAFGVGVVPAPANNYDIVVAGTAVEVLAATPTRQSALIQNVGEANIRVTHDGTTPTPTHGHQLRPGDTLSLEGPNCLKTAVSAIREGATSSSVSASQVAL